MVLTKIQQLRRGILAVQEQRWCAIMFAALAILGGLLLFVELVVPSISSGTLFWIHTADLIIAYLSLADFFIGIACAFNRRLYFRQNWPNLVSSVPVSTEVFRALRLLRFIRAARTIRAAADAKQIFDRVVRSKQSDTRYEQ